MGLFYDEFERERLQRSAHALPAAPSPVKGKGGGVRLVWVNPRRSGVRGAMTDEQRDTRLRHIAGAVARDLFAVSIPAQQQWLPIYVTLRRELWDWTPRAWRDPAAARG
jgi:hypothetical protein